MRDVLHENDTKEDDVGNDWWNDETQRTLRDYHRAVMLITSSKKETRHHDSNA